MSVFTFCKATDSLQPFSFFFCFCVFWSSEEEKKICNTNELNHGNVWKKQKTKQKKGQMLPIFKCNNWLHRMKIYRATLTNSGIEQCCLVVWPLFRVDFDFMDYLKFCWLNRFFFSFILRKKEKKKAHYVAHTRKSGSRLRKARVPEYQLHAILMYIFMMIKRKKMNKNVKETILSTESYGFQQKRKYLLFLNP